MTWLHHYCTISSGLLRSTTGNTAKHVFAGQRRFAGSGGDGLIGLGNRARPETPKWNGRRPTRGNTARPLGEHPPTRVKHTSGIEPVD